MRRYMSNLKEVLHHLAGSLVTLWFLFTPSGTAGYALGCTLLEAGNFFLNVSDIAFHRQPFLALCKAAFWVVNLSGPVLVYLYTFQVREPGYSCNAVASIAAVIVCILRQLTIQGLQPSPPRPTGKES